MVKYKADAYLCLSKEEYSDEKEFNSITIQRQIIDKKVLIVAHGGISIPVNCYFSGIPKGL